jgi:hypothetical protein
MLQYCMTGKDELFDWYTLFEDARRNLRISCLVAPLTSNACDRIVFIARSGRTRITEPRRPARRSVGESENPSPPDAWTIRRCGTSGLM